MTEKHEVCLIVIGDEILRGQVQDANTMYLAKSLLAVGIKIQRIVVIPDEVDVIAKEVSEASKNYPIVFTSGGIGPTHDDLTYEGVAKGLGLSLTENQELLEHLSKAFPDKPQARRLATVPSPCELVRVTRRDLKGNYSVVKVANVYILPGSPRYFRPSIDAIVPSLSSNSSALYCDSLDLEMDEFDLVTVLDDQAKRWAGRVAIGSYPQPSQEPRTYISLEGRCPQDVAQAKAEILRMLSANRLSAAFDEKLASSVYESRNELEHVARAFNILEQCYDKFSTSEVFLCFNGGKDCTVVLHLTVTFIKLRKLNPPICLYITGNAFSEVDEFVREAAIYYGLSIEWKEGPIREALDHLLMEKPGLQACLMGTRKDDPGAHALEPFAPTDSDWPEMMRVCPIIDWSYTQVWQFLLKHKVPYCRLYDEGYTSLGAQDKTTRNPLLRKPNDPSKYLPAHTLADDSTERQGRG